MADRHGEGGVASARRPGRTNLDDPSTTLLQRVQAHLPNATQVVGLLTLLIAGAALLVLAGLTLTGAVVALVFLGPLALLTSPIWVPFSFALLVVAAASLSFVGFAVAALAAATWAYRYFTGRHPVGADRVDRARSRLADTASHVKDYARREYGGYLGNRTKDAAPGA